MKRHNCVSAVCYLTLISLAFLAACERRDPPPAPVPRRLTPPGPVLMRDAAHMKQYLSSGGWRLVGRDANRRFRFSADGTFSASGEGLAALLGFSDTVAEVTGRWNADTTTLRLSEIEADGGGAPLAKSLPLGWVDGKLNINIGGRQYRRWMTAP